MSQDLSLKFTQNSAQFSLDFYNQLSVANAGKNIIFSPFSIQTCVALAYAGAKGETAAEMAAGLKLVANDRALVASSFKGVLDSYSNSPLLKIASKIFVKECYTINPEFNAIAKESFQSSSEEIDFTASVAAAKKINNWVEDKTNNKIKDLITPDSLDNSTRLVLVNVIHFKGDWAKKFKKDATAQEDFFINKNDSVKVDMMNGKDKYSFGYFEDLQCKALEMPYKNSDLSMLVLLPESRTGLKTLEEKLKTTSLLELTNRMSIEEVIVKFPKFKVEFEMELTEQLKALGIKKMFSNSAEFDNLLVSPEPLQVSKVIHKAFIEVNEEGSEAAAATGFYCDSMYEPPEMTFIADKPFFYAIKSRHHLFFAGSYHSTECLKGLTKFKKEGKQTVKFMSPQSSNTIKREEKRKFYEWVIFAPRFLTFRPHTYFFLRAPHTGV